MNYGDFKTYVLEHLSVDATRRGLEDFRARMIKNSVVELQRYIIAYRVGHTTSYQVADLLAEEHGMIGNMPADGIPEAFYIVSTELDTAGNAHPYCRRNRLDFVAWEDRHHLICSGCDRRLYGYAMSPDGRQFVIHPALNDSTYLLLVWDGIKINFDDGDTVPWPESASEASAAYVKWRISLEIDKNFVLAKEEQGIWLARKLSLYRDEQEKQDAEKPDQEYSDTLAPVPPAPNF